MSFENMTKGGVAVQILGERPLDTVRIVSADTDSGFAIVNRSDFDPTTMVKYVEPITASGAATGVSDALAVTDSSDATISRAKS